MSDSSIAFAAFGSDRVAIATDETAGVHTLKVTTGSPTDAIAIGGFGASKIVLGTAATAGVHTLCVTTGAANAAIALNGAAGEKILLATAQSGGVHVPCVTTDAANASLMLGGFGAAMVPVATVLSGGVHTLAVTGSPTGGFGVACFAADKGVLASAASGGVHSVAVSGLAPPYVGPLDYRPGAVGIGGTILFYSSYTGPGIRVRNPDTNVESDIDFTSMGVLDGAQIATAKGASATLAVVKMYAQDGSGNDYVQAAANKQPLLTASGPTGGWAVEFDGLDDLIQSPQSFTNPYTRYAIWNPVAWGGAAFDGNQAGAVFSGSASPNWVAGTFGLTGPVSFPTGAWSILTSRFNSSNGSLRRNKLSAVTGGQAGVGMSVSQIGGSWSAGRIAVVGILFYAVDDDTAYQDLVIDALGSSVGISV